MVFLLSDINGTLIIGTNLAHRDALLQAASETWDITLDGNDFDQAESHGKTDQQIMRQLLYAAQVPLSLTGTKCRYGAAALSSFLPRLSLPRTFAPDLPSKRWILPLRRWSWREMQAMRTR